MKNLRIWANCLALMLPFYRLSCQFNEKWLSFIVGRCFSIHYSVSLIAFTSNYRFACYCNFSVGNLSCTIFSSIFVGFFLFFPLFLISIFHFLFIVGVVVDFRCLFMFTSIHEVYSFHFIRRKQTKTLFLSVGRPMSGF